MIVVVLIVAAVAAVACAQFVVPNALSNYLKSKVIDLTHAHEVTLQLNALPSAKISLGYVDSLHCTADDATIDELNLKQATLDGTAIHIDVKELLMPTDGISREERTNRVLRSVDKLELSGVITAEGLSDFLARKVDRLQNPQVVITPEIVSASGKVKILGREADVQIGGKIVARDGDLYFQMGDLNVENAVLRRVNLDKFLGDFNLTENVKMPLGMEFKSVEMREGEAFVTASRN